MSGSRWPCVYPHLWNAYVWRRQRRKRARAKCWIIEELGRGRQNRLNEGQEKNHKVFFNQKSVRNIWYTLQILTNTLLTLNNAERQWIFSSKHIMSPVTRWLHKKTKTKTQHYNIQSLEMVTTKYEASAWQQSTENRTEQSARRGYKQATFFIKEQSWRKLNLPVSIAMWMQDKWREGRHERSNKTRREHAKEEKRTSIRTTLNEEEGFSKSKKKRGLKWQRKKLQGRLAQTWIPKTCQQRLPPSGEPGEHTKGKKNEICGETMRHGRGILIRASLQLVGSQLECKEKTRSCQMANKSSVDQLNLKKKKKANRKNVDWSY